jgi:hypothetical protein
MVGNRSCFPEIFKGEPRVLLFVVRKAVCNKQDRRDEYIFTKLMRIFFFYSRLNTTVKNIVEIREETFIEKRSVRFGLFRRGLVSLASALVRIRS